MTSKSTITITSVQETKSKAGQTYWIVQTDQGRMTCFDKPLADRCIVGARLDVEIRTSNDGKFKTIVQIDKSVVPVENMHAKQTELNFDNDYTPVYVGMVIDLVKSGVKQEDAVKIVTDSIIAIEDYFDCASF